MNQTLATQVENFKKKNFANTLLGGQRVRKSKKKDEDQRPLPPQLFPKDSKKRGRGANKKDKDLNLSQKKARSKFSLLASVVEFLKSNFMHKNPGPFSIDHVLEATSNTDIAYTDKVWLIDEALPCNPRVKMEGNMLSFKPVFDITDKRSLYNILIDYDERGMGGIYVDDIRESVAEADQVIRSLRNHICHFTRKDNDKDVIFLYQPSCNQRIDQEFVKLWKSVSLCGMEDKAIATELEKEGYKDLRYHVAAQKRPKPSQGVRRGLKSSKKITNTHLDPSLLKDYSNVFN